MRKRHAAVIGVLMFVLHGGASARPGRWQVDSTDVPNDPACTRLRKVVEDYFRRHPAMPDACVEAALGGAFEMPPLQRLANPSADFIAHIEKYLQVGAQSYFADVDRGAALEDMYVYRAEMFVKGKDQLFVWRGKMADQFSPYGTVPGVVKTILQHRRPKSGGGCDGKPDEEDVEAHILMKEDLSGPLRLEHAVIDNLLANARLRLDHGTPVFISGGKVFKQDRYGLSLTCSIKREPPRSR
ncbi:hypothetical protein NX784_15900 [Massilia pinisoli]|uniref:Uncharacterized protein n=1 Tax=Massilia pinisoli TaxID=1772194 RepID=A0ABT1ZT43_9BURK|nr:hypothetical protein [Massilia pinisoli]MCS0583073.1 hypothetical protein [Massilia pinisoli]